jgi:hypothetical protein
MVKAAKDNPVTMSDWPGNFDAVGKFDVALPGIAETARDFTRAFSACADGSGDMSTLGVQQLQDHAAAPVPMQATVHTGGDVNAENVAKACAEFKEQIVSPTLKAAGIELGKAQLEQLMALIIGNLTVTPGMEGLITNGASPAMFQNKYILMAAPLCGVRVVTYGFIGSATCQPLGDRPDRKYTPVLLRLVTDDLLALSEPG